MRGAAESQQAKQAHACCSIVQQRGATPSRSLHGARGQQCGDSGDAAYYMSEYHIARQPAAVLSQLEMACAPNITAVSERTRHASRSAGVLFSDRKHRERPNHSSNPRNAAPGQSTGKFHDEKFSPDPRRLLLTVHDTALQTRSPRSWKNSTEVLRLQRCARPRGRETRRQAYKSHAAIRAHRISNVLSNLDSITRSSMTSCRQGQAGRQGLGTFPAEQHARLGGLFDPASRRIANNDEDFGQSSASGA